MNILLVETGLSIGALIAGSQLSKLWPELGTVAYVSSLLLALDVAHKYN